MKSAALIEDIKGPRKDGGVDPLEKSVLNLRCDLHKAEKRIGELEDELGDAVEIAQSKTEQLNETIEDLRRYEHGEYGLEQALDEVRSNKRQIKIRDVKIEELTQCSNQLQYQCSELIEENASFREQLGLSPNHVVTSNNADKSIVSKDREDTNKYKALNQVHIFFILE